MIFGTGVMSALTFAGCSDDPPATNNTGGSGGSAAGTAGTGGSTGGSASGSGGGGAGGMGGMKTTGGTGGGGSGGAGGGGAGGGGAGGASGSGGGGAGGMPSEACMKLCMGADSIVTVCANEPGIDANLKSTDTCLQRCGKELDMAKVKCWQDHTLNYKNDMGDHCKHAGGATPCAPWPAL
jgi:hypothetical protein